MAANVVEGCATRDALLAMGQTGDVAKFLTLAHGALAEAPDDVELRMLLVRRLAERGLLYRAARVADGFPAEVRSHPDFGDMIRQLRTEQNNGLAQWGRFTGRFESNLRALRRRYDWADEVAAAWQVDGHHLELHRTASSLWQVFDRRPGGGWRPSFGRHCPVQTVEQIAAEAANKVLAPVVIDGVGLGFDLPHMHAATRDTFLGACPVIYQIEPCLLALAVALHLNDWQDLIADERVRLCAGDEARDQFARALEAADWAAVPQAVVRPAPWQADLDSQARCLCHASPQAGCLCHSGVGALEDCIGQVAQRLASRRVELRVRAASRYRGRDRAHWCRRFAAVLGDGEPTSAAKAPPLRVLGLTSRFTTVLQYSMRDALRAFASLGCETHLLIEPNNHSCVTPEKKLETLSAFEPDLVFAIDHTRRGQGDGMIADVPFLTWVQDRLPWLFDRSTGQAMGPLDLCMGFCRDELVGRHAYPAERFLACEMATDPGAFFPEGADDHPDGHGETDPDGDADRFACDVAFATHASQPPAAFHQAFRRRCDGEAGLRLIDAMYDELAGLTAAARLNGGLRFDAFMDRMERATGIRVAQEKRGDLIADFLRPMVDRLLRHQTISWTAAWAEATGRQFHLYGNGWETHPEYRRYARGTLRHGLELGRAFRGAAIHLHAGCNTALHQRVLDGLAAGAFFLIRRHAGDVGYRVSRAVHDLVRQKGLCPPATIRWKDLPGPLAEEFAELRRMNGIDPQAPVELTDAGVRNLRAVHEEKTVVIASGLWPEFETITFGTTDELAGRLDWHLAHPDARRSVAASMRARALEVFSYEVLMRKVLAWMTDALGSASCKGA